MSGTSLGAKKAWVTRRSGVRTRASVKLRSALDIRRRYKKEIHTASYVYAPMRTRRLAETGNRRASKIILSAKMRRQLVTAVSRRGR